MKVVYLEFHTSALGWVKKMANDSGFQKVTKSKGYHKWKFYLWKKQPCDILIHMWAEKNGRCQKT